jgi:hypothetical protein
MFENAMRLGRTWFGVVLCGVGPAMLLRGLTEDTPWNAPMWLAIGWAVAIAAGVAGTLIGSRRRVRRPLTPSLVWPSVGLALTLPLTIHLVIALGMGWAEHFDRWVWMSVRVAGHTHLVAAILLGWRAYQVGHGKKPLSPTFVYGAGVISALVPLIIPACFVTLTGLPFLAVMRYTDVLAQRDRGESDLPVARAIAA